VKLLDDERIDINIADIYLQTPFFRACEREHVEIVELLLIQNRRKVNTTTKDDEGKTALDVVREKGRKEKGFEETEVHFQLRISNCAKIVNLLESFERDPYLKDK